MLISQIELGWGQWDFFHGAHEICSSVCSLGRTKQKKHNFANVNRRDRKTIFFRVLTDETENRNFSSVNRRDRKTVIFRVLTDETEKPQFFEC